MIRQITFILAFSGLAFISLPARAFAQASPTARFAVIGDYGFAGQPEADVATLVSSWNPDFVVTTGDNNYEDGLAATIDQNIGQYYHQYIFPYTGAYGAGDTVNRFFPSLGNHDWKSPGAQPYLNYFALPGNERYYDFVAGNVQFFCIDSDTLEPDGTSSSSIQAQWLQNRLSISSARWRIVIFHHPPYTSGTTHGSTTRMRWPFQEWGATTVLCGHEHIYERIEINKLLYIVNGLGGKSLYPLGAPIAGSEYRYNSNYGAQLVTAYEDSIVFAFYNRAGTLIDHYTIKTVRSVDIRQNWNMVSVPLTASDFKKTALFPTAVSPAFFYQDAYLHRDTLANGEAYWLKFDGDQTVPVSGTPRTLDTIDVREGWNMVGSISSSVDVFSVASAPGGLITSRFFGYEGSYAATDSIRPGKGYWVKVNQNGKLILASSPAAVGGSARIKIVPTEELPPLPPNRDQESTPIPRFYSLAQNYPNPFNPSTSISFSIPKRAHVRLQVFNPIGQLIATLIEEEKLPGDYAVTWDASSNATGIYFYRISAGGFVATKKAVLIK